MTNETLMAISNIFCGNIEGFYKYKTGAELVSFFNGNFGYTDIYGGGFPSRHVYTENRLVDIYNKGKLEVFLNLILNKKYLMKELKLNETEAYEKSENILEEFNTILNRDGYHLQKKNNQFYLIQEDNDLEPIGSGGFANVFKQKSTGLIVKKLKEDYWGDKSIVHRFKREFEITKSLNEFPFIIKVYDYNQNNYSYTMEEAELTLEDYIKSNELNDETKIKVIRQILYAMSVIHSKDIIHRDISPNNIFIISGILKIADFGLGKDLNILNSHQTLYTNAVGQLAYCAPEQFMMLREGDKKSDVYSLGRLINFIMTKNPRNEQHMFRNIVNKATSDNSIYRYEDAKELLESVNKTIKYNENTARYENCSLEIKKGIYNEDIEQFIYELQPNKIVDFIIQKNNAVNKVFMNFMKQDENHAEFVIHSIEDVYQNMMLGFSQYDGIALFANNVINEQFDYLVKESACRILRYVAKYVNRFYAQGLLESIVQNGIEPSLEDILNE